LQALERPPLSPEQLGEEGRKAVPGDEVVLAHPVGFGSFETAPLMPRTHQGAKACFCTTSTLLLPILAPQDAKALKALDLPGWDPLYPSPSLASHLCDEVLTATPGLPPPMIYMTLTGDKESCRRVQGLVSNLPVSGREEEGWTPNLNSTVHTPDPIMYKRRSN
jgi:hypothetical protein